MEENTILPTQDNEPVQVEVSPELISKVNAIRALATTHNLLSKGMFTYGYAPLVETSLQFIESLHKQIAAEALAHPEASQVPELNTLANKGAQ